MTIAPLLSVAVVGWRSKQHMSSGRHRKNYIRFLIALSLSNVTTRLGALAVAVAVVFYVFSHQYRQVSSTLRQGILLVSVLTTYM